MRLLILIIIIVSFLAWVSYVTTLLGRTKKGNLFEQINIIIFGLIILSTICTVGFFMIKDLIIPFIMWLWRVKV